MLASQPRIIVSQHNHVCLIELNRPDKSNAFDSHMILQLSQALTDYEANDHLRCALIFSKGKNFTTGLDLFELQDKMLSGIFSFDTSKIDPWGLTGKARRKPYVIAIQGKCYTAGIELLLNCDVVVASQDSEFAQMEVQRGLMPFGGATLRFVRVAGWQKAMPYLLTGEKFDAITAERLNLISEIVPTGTAYQRGLAIATTISDNSAPLAVQALMQSAKQALNEGEVQAMTALPDYLTKLVKTTDFREGVQAMLEKRPAKFLGQ